MELSHWSTGDYPIYIDPTDYEITCLLGSGWDTLRGALFHKPGFDHLTLAIASGYGNTHDSINRMCRKYEYTSSVEEFIIYKEGDKLLINLTQTGPERATVKYILKNVPDLARLVRRVNDWFEGVKNVSVLD